MQTWVVVGCGHMGFLAAFDGFVVAAIGCVDAAGKWVEDLWGEFLTHRTAECLLPIHIADVYAVTPLSMSFEAIAGAGVAPLEKS